MKRFYISLLLSALLLNNCVSTGDTNGNGLSLMEAIENSAERIANDLPTGSRVAIVAFESANDRLSDYIMEELTGALFDRKIEVADRQNIGYLNKELDFQMSGNVSDESAKSIGKFLAADMVITGELLHIGNSYRYRVSAISVETSLRSSVTRLDVQGTSSIQRMIRVLANQQTTVRTARYGVSEDVTPQTAGTFLDRGIMFIRRGEYDKAIANLNEAIKLNPNNKDTIFFMIETYEAQLSKNPNNESLLLTTGFLYIIGAEAVQFEAEILEVSAERYDGYVIAKQLYLKGYEYLKYALDRKFPGFSTATVNDKTIIPILTRCRRADVPFLYWIVRGGISAYSLNVFDLELGAKMPEWKAILDRAYELDPDFLNGAIDNYYIELYVNLPASMGGDKNKAEVHFRRALEKGRGLVIETYVSYARNICIPNQDYEGFKGNLEKALAIDIDKDPSNWLFKAIAQRRARYLLENANQFFNF